MTNIVYCNLHLYRRYFPFFFFLFSFFFFLFLSCNKDSTKPETVTFSGTVTLEGRTDYSGVKVSLYKPVELDTALVRINQQYPNIGVQISQETEFDHREHTPLYSTTTDASGHWQIKGVTPGTYNVVAEKDSFGWRYVLLTNTTSQNFNLRNRIYLNGIINNARLFHNDFIIISGNTIIETSGSFQFNGKNYLHFASTSDLIIWGSFTVDQNAKIFIQSDNDNVNALLQFENINNLSIHDLITRNNIKLYLINCSTIFQNSVLSNPNSYALRFSRSTMQFKNSTIINSSTGTIIEEAGTVLCQDNLFYDNEIDLDMFSVTNATISNNLFVNSDMNVNLVFSNADVRNNEFEESQENINIADISNIEVRYNQFATNWKNIRLVWVSHQPSGVELLATKNNFIETESYIFEIPGKTAKDTINAQENYWGTTNSFEIDKKIYDRNDFPLNFDMQYVIYQPFSISILDSAGIVP
jgi:hypothetical protein